MIPVHARDCCLSCGCQYGDDHDCPVVQGKVHRVHPCATCAARNGWPLLEPGVYEHYSGDPYYLLGTARDRDREIDYAVYYNHKNELQIRPVSEWREWVGVSDPAGEDVAGVADPRPRFRRLVGRMHP